MVPLIPVAAVVPAAFFDCKGFLARVVLFSALRAEDLARVRRVVARFSSFSLLIVRDRRARVYQTQVSIRLVQVNLISYGEYLVE